MSCGFEGFQNQEVQPPQQPAARTCVYTAQGAIVCNANTEYDKWMAIDKPKASSTLTIPSETEKPFYDILNQ
jgi:hypothetical protein